MALRDVMPRTERSIALAIAAGVWAIVYVPRVFLLGLYADDWQVSVLWPTLEEPARIKAYGFYFIDRPLQGVVLYLLGALWQGFAPGYHATLVLIVALAAYALFRALEEVAETLEFPSPSIAAGAGTCVWLAMPWNIGFTGWVMCNPELGAQIAFCVFLVLALTRMPSWGTVALCAAATFVGNLFYEALYFQQLAVMPIVAMHLYRFKGWTRWAVIYAVAFIGVTLLNVLLNRLYAFLSLGPVKGFVDDWPGLLRNHLGFYLPKIVNALPETAWAAAAAAGILVLCAAIGIAVLFTNRRSAISVVAFAASFAFGYAGGQVILALGGYYVWFVGPDTRVDFAFSFWLAAACGALASIAMATRWSGRVAVAAAAALTLSLGIATAYRTSEWAEASRRQAATINRFPLAQLPAIVPDALVVYLAEEEYASVPIWASSRDLSSAAAVRYQRLYPTERLVTSGNYRPAAANRITTWDGSIYQNGYMNGGDFIVQERRHSDVVWIYNGFTGRLWQERRPFRIERHKISYSDGRP